MPAGRAAGTRWNPGANVHPNSRQVPVHRVGTGFPLSSCNFCNSATPNSPIPIPIPHLFCSRLKHTEACGHCLPTLSGWRVYATEMTFGAGRQDGTSVASVTSAHIRILLLILPPAPARRDQRIRDRWLGTLLDVATRYECYSLVRKECIRVLCKNPVTARPDHAPMLPLRSDHRQ